MEYSKIENRKLHYNYIVEESYMAGIVLKGSEVKSIRDHKVNINEAYCILDQNNELYLKNAHISASNDKMFSHDELRDRKLLLTKKELKNIKKWVIIKGNTIIPESISIPKNGYIKVFIGLCKGKHDYDKRETIKQRDIERDLKTIKL